MSADLNQPTDRALLLVPHLQVQNANAISSPMTWGFPSITAFTGPIAFVGVVIPHFARSFFGTVNHRTIIPATLLLGGILLIICDILSQVPISNRTLPINAVTAVFGAPMIVWIVLKRKKL